MTVLCDNGTFTAQITKSPSGAQIPLEWTIYVQAYEADIAWGMVSASGGRFVVTFTQDPRSEEWSTDKTFAECVAAWEAGKNLFSLADGTYYPMTSVTTESDEVASITFYMADAESQTISGYCIDAEGVYYYSAGE